YYGSQGGTSRAGARTTADPSRRRLAPRHREARSVATEPVGSRQELGRADDPKLARGLPKRRAPPLTRLRGSVPRLARALRRSGVRFVERRALVTARRAETQGDHGRRRLERMAEAAPHSVAKPGMSTVGDGVPTRPMKNVAPRRRFQTRSNSRS